MAKVFLPFLELFEAMQSAMQPLGTPLGIEQYDLLCCALDQGYGLVSWDGEGLVSWETLRRICRVLWVKPTPRYEAALKVFNQTFDRYIEQYENSFPNQAIALDVTPKSDLPEPRYPEIPPRRGQTSETAQTGEIKAIAAVNTGAPKYSLPANGKKYKLTPQDFPLTLTKVQQNWRSLRQSVREGTAYEVDIDATVAQITRQGVMDDVVMRSVMQQRAELIVLVDDNDGMVPFRPAIAPLIQAVEGGWVSPAQIYRFTSYVDQYLYGWRKAGQATAVNAVLSRLHPSRTVMLIVSDGGAALGSVSGAQIVGMRKFVDRAFPCVRQLIWLNPLPRERWSGNSAQAIAEFLAGQMIELGQFDATMLRSRELGGVLV